MVATKRITTYRSPKPVGKRPWFAVGPVTDRDFGRIVGVDFAFGPHHLALHKSIDYLLAKEA